MVGEGGQRTRGKALNSGCEKGCLGQVQAGQNERCVQWDTDTAEAG
jgi:hypothetical protein